MVKLEPRGSSDVENFDTREEKRNQKQKKAKPGVSCPFPPRRVVSLPTQNPPLKFLPAIDEHDAILKCLSILNA